MIKTFLQDWQAWVDAGAVDGRYQRSEGLCVSFDRYLINSGHHKYIGDELAALLYDTCGTRLCPFGGSVRFLLDTQNRTMHENPMRLAWVKEQLKC